jgi:two-component system sensor histidine kinase RegB
MASPDDPHAIHRINLSWIVRLRWAAILGQSAVIAYVQWPLGIALPLRALIVVLAFELLTNVGTQVWLRQQPAVTERMVFFAMALDVSTFSVLLYFTGGPMNPFSFLYLVHISLGALVLRAHWTWMLVLLSAGASAALFVQSVPLDMMHGGHSGHQAHLDLHLRGMWVAFAVAAAFIVYFLHRVTRALTNREAELRHARDVASRSERLAAMATLAAGAAHELATPLSTIAVVAKELERSTAPIEGLAADARLIREQVDRCRDILGQMAGGAGQSVGEVAEPSTAEAVVRIAVTGLQRPDRVRVEWEPGSKSKALVVPVRATAQALRNVLKNSLDASSDTQDVVLHVAHVEAGFRLEVRDTGTGMTPEVLARVSEPFFTTKEPGSGMGLGLFLTRSVVELIGGSVDIESELGKGTRVVLQLPGEAATNGRIAAALAS